MGIYIKGIEMPTDNTVLLRIYPKGDDGVFYVEQLDIDDDILDEYWAVPVPSHGDLIDYSFCLKNYELLHDDEGNPVYAVRMRDINAAPTVIEAEGASE